MSIETEIVRLQQAKADLKVSINAKGVTPPITDETIDGYAGKIDTLPEVLELTQAQYDGLFEYDNNTYYLIVEE